MVKVYYRTPSASSPWPTGWVFIGQASLTTNIPAGQQAIISVPWTPPTPTNTTAGKYLHTCMLARICYPGDPMTFPEVGNPTITNTRKNNNIVWKNVDIISTGQRISEVIVSNDEEVPVTLRVLAGFNDFTRPFGNNGNTVILRPDAPIRAKINSGEITLVNFTDDGDLLTMRDNKAWFDIPAVPPGMACTIGLEFVMPNEYNANLEDPIYNFTIEQFNDGTLEGGVTYNAVREIPDVAPLAPSNLSATLNGQTDVDLNWNDLSGNEIGFIIQRSKDDTLNFESLPTMAPANSETITDFDLEPNTTYYYRIKPTNDFGTDGITSNIAEVTTLRLSISGLVLRPDLSPVPPTDVNLTGGLTETRLTDASGAYAFEDNLLSVYYAVTPYNDSGFSIGLSNLDLIFAKLNILGSITLCSPYSRIAADVSGDGSISNLDIIIMKQAILGNITEFPFNQTSWRFVPSAYDFPDPSNPSNFPELLEFDPLAIVRADADFVGIKMGDISGNCPGTAKLIRKYGAPLELNIGESMATKGAFIEIPVIANSAEDLETFQYTHSWNPKILKFVGVDNFALEGMSEQDFGQKKAANGQLPVLWMASGTNGVDLTDNTTLYTLKFEVIGDTNEQSSIAITSDLLDAQGYNHQLEQLDIIASKGNVRVIPTDRTEKGELALYPNVPNPFSESTSIQFYLPTDGEVEMTIYNSIGQMVMTKKGQYPAGDHSFEWNRKSTEGTQATGIYLLHITAEGQSATMKLLVND